MNQIQGNGFSIEQMTNQLLTQNRKIASSGSEKGTLSFQEILQKQQIETSVELKFSKHANERMIQRNIDLSEDQMIRLEGAVKKAGDKGIQESLVMLDNLAFIVNIKNNTVVTAVDRNDDKVFTNIDGAVIV